MRPEPRRRAEVGDVLLAALRHQDDRDADAALHRLLDGIDVTRLPLEADHHSIGPLAFRAFSHAPSMTEPARRELGALYDRQWQVHLRVLASLDLVGRVLDDLGVAWVTFKGPTLVEHAYRGAEVRSYVDLDVLVDRRRIGPVLDALVAAGARLQDRNWHLINADMRGEVTVIMPNGSSMDLHWHLVNEPAVRKRFAIDVDGMLARARRRPVDDRSAATLDAVDSLLVLCLHTTLSGGHRLVWYKDLERVMATEAIDWDTVVARARRWGTGLVTAVALDRAVRLLDAEVPDQVLRALAPTWGWRGMVRALDRRRPIQRSFGRPMSGRVLLASTRGTTAASLVALGRAVGSQLLVEVVRNPDHPWRRRGGAAAAGSTPNPLWRDEGTPEDRQRWLDRIAAT